MNQRPSGYEPDELPAAPLRDIYVSLATILLYTKRSENATLFLKKLKTTKLKHSVRKINLPDAVKFQLSTEFSYIELNSGAHRCCDNAGLDVLTFC